VVAKLDDRIVPVFVDRVVRPVPSVTDDRLTLLIAPELLGRPLARIVLEFLGRSLREGGILIQETITDAI